jgi:serine protease
VIVKFKALGGLMRAMRADPARPQGPQHAAILSQRHGLVLRDGRIIEGRSQVVWGDKGMSSAALAARLAADAEVEYAVPDYRRHALALPNDPLFAANAGISPAVGQWYLRAPDATFVSAINAVGAWAVTTGSASVVVADVDTGVLFNHPDLVNKLYPGYDFITDVATAGDGNGRDSDATDPGDWTTAASGCAAQPSSWHGTQTSGIIGAQSNNGAGMASVGYDVRVLPVRVLGKCGGSDSDIAAAMLWAGGITVPGVPANPHPARVINLSLGGSGSCAGSVYPDVVAQLTAAGVVVVAAAGNDEGLAVGVPANCSGVIAVTGMRHVGTKVGFSSIGPEVAIAAPGGNCVNTVGPCLYPILTSTNSGTTTAAAGGNTYSNSTNYSVGTSFATPMVAGTVALMLSANPALTPAQIRGLLQSSARAFPTSAIDAQTGGAVPQCHAPNGVAQDECVCTTSTCGAGLLDAGGAVSAAEAIAAPKAVVSTPLPAVTVGASLNFDGSASTIPVLRTLKSYQWVITSGGTIATISGAANAAAVTVATTGIGSFTIQLTVTDSSSQQATASSTVTVNAPAAPTVNIVSSAGSATPAGSSVTFDGGSSSAAAGSAIKSYQWAITSGAGIASFTSATNATTATVATAGNGSGNFTVQLTVTDIYDTASSASSTVNVTAVAPTAGISAATTALPGSSVTFDGSASTATAGRTITGYQWAITSGGAIASFSGGTTGASATVVTSAAGIFTVQLTVTDSVGAQSSRSASVSVAAPASSGGGGGALSLPWLLGLAIGVAALARTRSRRVRAG